MKKHVLISLLAILAGSMASCQLSEKSYQPSEEVARNFILRVPDPDSIHWVGETNHFSWQAGYIMFAMEKMWHYTGDSIYYNYIRRYVDQQVGEDGSIPDFQPTAMDNFLPGYAILFMYESTGLEKYKIAATTIRRGLETYPRTSNGLFWHSTGRWAAGQVWVDGVFMGEIFMARYGKLIDSEAFTEVTRQMTRMAALCQKENGLLLHGWNEDKTARWANKDTGLAAEVWSEGAGWYAVLLADVFDFLPPTDPAIPQLQTILHRLCAGIKTTQDPHTGLWYQVVDKGNEAGNWHETSGSAMFIYLLQKALNKGYISKEEYEPVIARGYRGLLTKKRINDQGFIELIDCSSIGIQTDYKAYISQPREINPFAATASYIIGIGIGDFDSNKR